MKSRDTFLSAKARERRAERDEIHKILKKLKEKERELRAEVAAAEGDAARSALEATRNVVHAQRRKGVEVLKPTRKRKGRQAARVPPYLP